jgi:NTE family protein
MRKKQATREDAAAAGESGIPSLALALQGGGSHGAFTWGVLDRLLDDVAQDRLALTAVSGSSAGAINAALLASGLAQGVEAARSSLRRFWESLSQGSFAALNRFFFPEPSPFGGWNIDSAPLAAAADAFSMVVSPYANPFYVDALTPLLEAAFPADVLARLNGPGAMPAFMGATNVRDNTRAIFTQPRLTIDTLRASAALPTEFRAVTVDGAPYWDGGYLGNPPLRPLADLSQDLMLILANPFILPDAPPTSAPAILARLNEITFNASLVLEVNGIEAVNRVLAALAEAGAENPTGYRSVRFHRIRSDAFLASLGYLSKNSTSAALIATLFQHGRDAAEAWLGANRDRIGRASSCDVHAEMIEPVLGGGRRRTAPVE